MRKLANIIRIYFFYITLKINKRLSIIQREYIEEIQQNVSKNSKLCEVLTYHIASFFLQLHSSLEYHQPSHGEKP